MSEFVVNPRREKGEPLLEGTGVLLVNPADASLFKNVLNEYEGRRHFLFNSNLYQVAATDTAGPFFVAGPAVGAPMAALVVEKLIALGARQIILYGWCGSLSESLHIGDILLPTWALSEEGTSRHYSQQEKPHSSSNLRGEIGSFLDSRGLSTREGPVWTTDAPYRESRDKVSEYSAQGLVGVDMEFSALCSVAACRQIEFAAVMIVSDELWREQWKPGFRNSDFKKKSPEVVRALFEYCR